MHYENIVKWIEAKTGHPLNRDEGLRFGVPAEPLRKVMICWMATLTAIEEAAQWGADLIIAHEALFHPYYLIGKELPPEDYLSWKANAVRINMLSRAQLAVMRCHGSADEICIFDAFLKKLNLKGSMEGEGFYKIYNIKPVAVRALAEKVKAAVKMEGIRVAGGNLETTVKKIGFPWGGLGLFVNIEFMQKLVEDGCDCVIAGESDSYAMQYALDSGLALIETSHEESENPGLQRLAEILGKEFPDVESRFFETKRPFIVL